MLRVFPTRVPRQTGSATAPRPGRWLPSWQGVALAVALSAAAPAQSTRLAMADGRILEGEIVGFEPGAAGSLDFVTGGVTRSFGLGDVLSFHRVAPVRTGSVEVRLVGGETLNGEIGAGDADGETFGLRSSTLGQLAVPIDRLDVMMFRDRAADAGPDAFRIPADAEADEALFRRARRVGFSRVSGGIHRFRGESVLFEVDGRKAESFRYEDLVAIALRGGLEREGPPESLLLTRSGDVVGVDVRGFRDGHFAFVAETLDAEFELGVEDIASLAWVRGRTFLSDLTPESVDERGYFDEGEALLPHRRDRSVTGNYLVAGNVAHAKGIGVHSFSALRYRVPAGVTTFHAQVGLCDEVRELGIRARVVASVIVNDDVRWSHDGLDSASGARSVGAVSVEPGDLLELRIEFGDGLDLGDRVAWLGAVLF